MKKKILTFSLLLLTLIFIVSCNNTLVKTGESIKLIIDNNVKNLDPQTSSTDNEIFINDNIMEGLMSIDRDGNITEGLAKSYEILDDGLTYSFKLKDDASWVNYRNEPPTALKNPAITSYDFLFAFQRIFTLKESFENYGEYMIIKNSKEVSENLLDISELGISTPDDKTIVFHLNTPNKKFLQLLAMPPAFPCNEVFFESTEGKYGLDYKSLIYSGAFIISIWNDKDYLVLRKNQSYYDKLSVLTDRIDISLNSDEEKNIVEDFDNEKTDIINVVGSDFLKIKPDEITYTSAVDSTWALLFNKNNRTLDNHNISSAFKHTLDFDGDTFSEDPIWFEKATNIVPKDTKIDGYDLYTNYIDINITNNLYNKDLAKDYLEKGLLDLEINTLNDITIVYPKSDYFTIIMQQIQKKIQTTLSIFVNVKPVDDKELQDIYQSGEYDIIFYNFSGNINSPYDMLDNFSGYLDISYKDFLNTAQLVDDNSISASYYRDIEESLINSGLVFPVLQQSSFKVINNKIANIIYSPFSGNMLFKYAFKAK